MASESVIVSLFALTVVDKMLIGAMGDIPSAGFTPGRGDPVEDVHPPVTCFE
ncbi:MAG: hypothetical protein IPH27_06220 [Actinomycetales bacterium]|nr:hypothetical protein [Candidatus Phosphoribacter baldrii]